MDKKTETQNECRCAKAGCGCVEAIVERCSCGNVCPCKTTCRCAGGCGCAAAK